MLVLNSSRYDFINEKTGERVSGGKIQYLTGDKSGKQGTNGVEVLTGSCTIDVADKITTCPGVYDMQFTMQQRDKATEIRPVDAVFVAAVDLKQAMEKLAQAAGPAAAGSGR